MSRGNRTTFHHNGKRVNKRSALQSVIEMAVFRQNCARNWAMRPNPDTQMAAECHQEARYWLDRVLTETWGAQNYVVRP